MKKVSLFSLLLLCSVVMSSYTCIWEVPLKGSWGDEKDLRLPIPASPTASVDQNVLLIHFTSSIAGLQITISDENGNEVYNEPFSAPFPGYSLEITSPDWPGVLFLKIVHPVYGYLEGTFSL